MNVLAQEGRKHDIRVNTLSPTSFAFHQIACIGALSQSAKSTHSCARLLSTDCEWCFNGVTARCAKARHQAQATSCAARALRVEH